jgi:hypothetical protein
LMAKQNCEMLLNHQAMEIDRDTRRDERWFLWFMVLMVYAIGTIASRREAA